MAHDEASRMNLNKEELERITWFIRESLMVYISELKMIDLG